MRCSPDLNLEQINDNQRNLSMNQKKTIPLEKKGAVKRFLNFTFSLIDSIENSNLPFYNFIFITLAYLMLRNVVENFSAASAISLSNHLHFTLFGLFTFLSIILIIRLFTGIDTVKTFKVFSTFLFFILIGPVFDVLTSFGRITGMAYISVQNIQEMISKFFLFSGRYTGPGITTGMKLHVAAILFSLFVYVYIKTGRNLLRSAAAVFSVYCAIYLIGVLPFIFEKLGFRYENMLFSIFYFIGSVVLFAALFYLSSREFFITVIKDTRPYRALHYISMFFLGIVAGLEKYSLVPQYFQGIAAIVIIAILSAGIFSIITNNFSDIETDSVSNPERPLFKKGFSVENYKILSFVCLFLAMAASALAGYTVFLLICVFIGLYYLYSMPPVRFKRVPVLSKSVVSLNSLVLAFAGYAVVAPDPTSLRTFPVLFIVFFLIPFTLAANFIDIKDYEGDGKAGIKTLPVILGLKWSKRLIGAFFFFAYLFAGAVFPRIAIFCITVGLVQFFLIKRANYSEHPVFILYLISVISFITMLYFGVVTIKP